MSLLLELPSGQTDELLRSVVLKKLGEAVALWCLLRFFSCGVCYLVKHSACVPVKHCKYVVISLNDDPQFC